MSRMLVASNLALVLAVCLLAWMLHAERQSSSRGLAADGLTGPQQQGPLPAGEAELRALSARLDRIDSRLEALARDMATPSPMNVGAVTSAADEAPALSAAEADRRLNGMLPGPVVDHAAMARYRAQLAMLPPEQQAAIEKALSRAINQDRLRLRM